VACDHKIAFFFLSQKEQIGFRIFGTFPSKLTAPTSTTSQLVTYSVKPSIHEIERSNTATTFNGALQYTQAVLVPVVLASTAPAPAHSTTHGIESDGFFLQLNIMDSK
jgi:hypothetical protein